MSHSPLPKRLYRITWLYRGGTSARDVLVGSGSQQEKVGERRKYEMGELRSQVCICTNFVCVYLCTMIGMARGLHAIGYISVRNKLGV